MHLSHNHFSGVVSIKLAALDEHSLTMLNSSGGKLVLDVTIESERPLVSED